MTMRGLRLVLHAAMLLALSFSLSSSGVVPVFMSQVHAAPLFSVTLIVANTYTDDTPPGNTVRIEYAKKITRNMVALGIDAKLVQLKWSDLEKRLFFLSPVSQGALYATGGYDIGFIGWGYSNITKAGITNTLPSIDGRSANWAPNGNNYALYNNAEVNSLIDQFNSASNETEEVSLLNQIQAIVFHDKPYNYIYELKSDNDTNGYGWQEQAFNMKHPVFGTGVATPLGQSNPSQSAEAARHVRTAISHLIPRDKIANSVDAHPLATWVGPNWGAWYNQTFAPDTYDMNAAATELRAAGYQVPSFVAEIPLVAGWNLISLPVISSTSAITTVLAQLPTGEVTVVWSYAGTGSTRSWMYYKPGTGGSLTTMVDGNGYWIYVTSADTLYVPGYVIAPASVPPTYSLVLGWNLVGFKPQPSIANETVHNYLATISGKYDPNNVWILDNSNGNWIRATDSTWIRPGEAMWVLMVTSATLRP